MKGRLKRVAVNFSDTDRNESVIDAEAAYREFLDRRSKGEDLDLEAFCAERPSLSDALKILHSERRERLMANAPTTPCGGTMTDPLLTFSRRRGEHILPATTDADLEGISSSFRPGLYIS